MIRHVFLISISWQYRTINHTIEQAMYIQPKIYQKRTNQLLPFNDHFTCFSLVCFSLKGKFKDKWNQLLFRPNDHLCSTNCPKHRKTRYITPEKDVFGVTESRDLFKFWEISDNISLTLQDRDIHAVEH